MVELGRVLFQVGAGDADAFGRLALGFDLDPAIVGQRVLVLADLIVFGKVGVPVAFSLPEGVFGGFTIDDPSAGYGLWFDNDHTICCFGPEMFINDC